MSRRTILAPILPNPIIASCMTISPLQPSCGPQPCHGGGDRRSSHCALELAVPADQGVGRAVMGELGLCLALELRDDALSQNLAEFDAPLIEGVDVPDGALGEHAVLI